MYIATTSFVREDGRLAIYAYMLTGHEVRLFAYYSDELSFSSSDFVGRTVRESTGSLHAERRSISALLKRSYAPRAQGCALLLISVGQQRLLVRDFVSKVFHPCFTGVSNDPVPKTRVSELTTEQHYPSVVT